MQAAIAKLEELGATIDWDVSLPHTPYALAVYYIIAPSEASANLARYDGVKYGFSYKGRDSMWEAMEKTRQHGFGPEVKRRIMLGTYALSAGYYDAYYLKAQKVRTLIRREFDAAFREVRRPGHPHLPHRPLQDRREDGRPRSRCTSAMSAPCPSISPGCPASPSRPASPTACPSACRSSASPSARRPSSASPTPTSRRPSGIREGRRFRR